MLEIIVYKQQLVVVMMMVIRSYLLPVSEFWCRFFYHAVGNADGI